MERILGGVQEQDRSDEYTPEGLYHRVEIVKKIEKDNEELFWMAKGVPSEADKIRRYSLEHYLQLLKYTIEQSRNGKRDNIN
jgi:hypothetical protein